MPTRSAGPAAPPSRARRWTEAGIVLYATAVVCTWIAVRFLGDRVALFGPLVFGPRWVLALPAVIVFPAALVFGGRRHALASVVIAAFALGPVCGLSASPKALLYAVSSRPPRDLRVMSHNLGQVPPGAPEFAAALAAVKPDIIALQECGVSGDKLEMEGWFSHVDHGLCLLSRFPILRVDARDRRDVWNRGGSGAIDLYDIDAPGGPISFLNVHLETVREGLEALRARDFAEADANLRIRAWESDLATSWAKRATAPLIVAGDFNMPVDSAIYRTYWSDFTNAFSVAGLGYGKTKQTRYFGVRIDHVLTGPGWECVDAWVGPATGSDHLPVVADLRRVR